MKCRALFLRWHERIVERFLLWVEDAAYDLRQWMYDRAARARGRE